MADVEFRVLGRVAVLRGGEEVSVGRSTTLNLLAGLLVSANTAVSRGALAELAWGDNLPGNPRASLHTKVARLRQVLGDGVIETVGDAYLLRADESQLDLLRFESLISQAMAMDSDEQAANTLAEAIALWRGDPLSNIVSPALSGEATVRLTERYLLACERWAEVSLRLGRAADVIQRAIPLVKAHPFREPMVRLLMLGLQHDGRQSEALTAYEVLRSRLREDLGADPGPALQELHTAILRGATAEARPAHQRWSGARPMPGGLIGRDRDVIDVARTLGQHSAVTVIGPAGVGKTALALQAAAHLVEQSQTDVTVAELGFLPAQQDSDPSAIAGLLLAVLRVSATAAIPAEETLLESLHDSSELIVLDNAEHVVTAAAQLADAITRNCPRVRVIITSRRPLGHSTEKVVELAPLSPADSAQLLRLRMADYGAASGMADDASVNDLCRLIEGLPLAVELAAARLRTMSLRTLLDRIATHPDLLDSVGRPGLAHQRGLTTTLRWSYDLLAPEQRLLLRRLGVFAGPFSLRDAEFMGGYDPIAGDDVAILLSGLADNSLVQVARNNQGYSYRLLWPIREFAVSQAPDSDLDSLRARHLGWLTAAASQIGSADDDDRDRLIVMLLDRFGEILQALDWGLRSGTSPGDLERGVQLLLATQPVWERQPGAARIVLGHATRLLADAANDLPCHVAADLTTLAGYLHFRTGDLQSARPLLESARSATGHACPEASKRQALALSLLAGIAVARLEPDAAEIARQSCEAARQSADPATIVVRLSVAAEVLAVLGHLEEAGKLIGEAELAIGSARSLRSVFLARRAQVFLRAHDAATALADAEEILSSQAGITTYDQVAALRSRGIAQTFSGQPESALATLTEALRLARKAQAGPLLPELAEALGLAEYRAGNLRSAIEHVREGLAWTLANADFIDAMGLLHLAVVLSAEVGMDTIALAALVRECRLGVRLTTWPFPETEYSRVEQALGMAAWPIHPRPVWHGSITNAGQLALKQLDHRLWLMLCP